jgi:hypothetical protein
MIQTIYGMYTHTSAFSAALPAANAASIVHWCVPHDSLNRFQFPEGNAYNLDMSIRNRKPWSRVCRVLVYWMMDGVGIVLE